LWSLIGSLLAHLVISSRKSTRVQGLKLHGLDYQKISGFLWNFVKLKCKSNEVLPPAVAEMVKWNADW
jgi:hypothetical protein